MGFVIMLMAFIFCTLETIYFGVNLMPQSHAELLADGFSVLIFVIGVAVLAFETRNRNNGNNS